MVNQANVRAFHEKHGYPCGLSLEETAAKRNDHVLEDLAAYLDGMSHRHTANGVEQMNLGDPRLYRIALMMEELGEIADALANGDEVALADGLGDLHYLVIGTAETYNIDMDFVTTEVHNSNMSKKVRDPDADPRLKDKGPDYFPPNIEEAIKKGREWSKFRQESKP